MLWRAVQVIGWCLVVASAVSMAWIYEVRGSAGETPVVEYKDFVSILLTSLGVMIAVAAVAAAFAAIWGFEFMRREVVKAAIERAEKVAKETATQVAQTKIDEIVPGLVEKTAKIDREISGPRADKIAEEFRKET
jgi:hypothetical protein